MNASSFILEQENADLRGLVRELKKEIYQLKEKIKEYEQKDEK